MRFAVKKVLPLLLALASLAAAACSSSYLGGHGDGNGKETENKPSTESGKPTDDSEGVPGYLVDPEQLAVHFTANETKVDAPAGSVATDAEAKDDEPSAVRVSVRLYEISSKNLANPEANADGSWLVAATLISQVLAENDGSFSLTAEPTAGALLVSVAPQTITGKVLVQDHPKGVTAALRVADGGETFKGLPQAALGVDTTKSEEGSAAVCTKVDGFCWYLGEPAASCEATCTERGGTDDATISHVGSSGSLDACVKVMRALKVEGVAMDQDPDSYNEHYNYYTGIGCAAPPGRILRTTLPVTTQTDVVPLTRRACACKK